MDTYIFAQVVIYTNNKIGAKRKKAISLGIIHLVRTQNIRKTNMSYPLKRTRTYAYQGIKNVNFSEYFAYELN